MNTHKALNVLCDACSGLYHTVSFALKCGEKARADMDLNTVLMFNNMASVIREMHAELPDSIKTEESIKAVGDLYWHVHDPDGDESDANIKSFRAPLSILHQFAHDSFHEMCEMRDKYGFES